MANDIRIEEGESDEGFLTRKEVADRYGVPVKTLAVWASSGIGPKYYKIGKWARYKMSDLVAWEETQVAGGGAR